MRIKAPGVRRSPNDQKSVVKPKRPARAGGGPLDLDRGRLLGHLMTQHPLPASARPHATTNLDCGANRATVQRRVIVMEDPAAERKVKGGPNAAEVFASAEQLAEIKKQKIEPYSHVDLSQSTEEEYFIGHGDGSVIGHKTPKDLAADLVTNHGVQQNNVNPYKFALFVCLAGGDMLKHPPAEKLQAELGKLSVKAMVDAPRGLVHLLKSKIYVHDQMPKVEAGMKLIHQPGKEDSNQYPVPKSMNEVEQQIYKLWAVRVLDDLVYEVESYAEDQDLEGLHGIATKLNTAFSSVIKGGEKDAIISTKKISVKEKLLTQAIEKLGKKVNDGKLLEALGTGQVSNRPSVKDAIKKANRDIWDLKSVYLRAEIEEHGQGNIYPDEKAWIRYGDKPKETKEQEIKKKISQGNPLAAAILGRGLAMGRYRGNESDSDDE